MTGVSLAGVARAKKIGALTLVEVPSLHPDTWQDELAADCTSAGIRAEQTERYLPYLLTQRQEREFAQCDRIVVYSLAAWRSFQRFPYAHKVVMVWPGIDHHFFTPPLTAKRDRPFRACFVGRIEAAKGIHYLIRAWKRLALSDAELVLAGRIMPEIASLLEKEPVLGIRLTGIRSRKQVVELYAESDVFVFPSVNEGFGLAVLEALSCGLPAIACEDTGAADCLTEGVNGLLVRGRDPDVLAEALQHCYTHREELVEMGKQARMRIEQVFTSAHYAERLIQVYQSLARPKTETL